MPGYNTKRPESMSLQDSPSIWEDAGWKCEGGGKTPVDDRCESVAEAVVRAGRPDDDAGDGSERERQ